MFLRRIIIFILIIVLLGAVAVNITFAREETKSLYPEFEENILNPAKTTAEGAGYSSEVPGSPYPALFVGYVINVILSFLGALFLIIIIYGGFLWMTAGGNEEQITKAKNLLKNGTIGLLIILGAYIITYTVVSLLGGSTGYEVGNLNRS